MHQGKVTGIIENSPDLTQEELMAYATNTMDDYYQAKKEKKAKEIQ